MIAKGRGHEEEMVSLTNDVTSRINLESGKYQTSKPDVIITYHSFIVIGYRFNTPLSF